MADLTDFYPQTQGAMAPTPNGTLAIGGGVSQSLSGNLAVSGEPWWFIGALVVGVLLLHYLGE